MAQIATITVETAGGPVDLPVYEPGDSGSNRLEAFRVQTASGPGFVPLAAVDEADRPYLRVQTSSGVRAVDTSASGIPDSVVSRPDDDNTATDSNNVGLFFETSQEWPDFQAKLSSNHDVSFDSELILENDDTNTQIDSIDISNKDGQVVTFNGVDLPSNTKFALYCSTSSSRTRGYLQPASPPYTSSDGNLSITSGYSNGSSASSTIYAIKRIGNINL